MKQLKFKKIGILDVSDSYRKVLYWFFSYPSKEISLNDLVEFVGISKSTAHKIVLRLSKEGFLSIEVLGKMWRIHCNQSHAYNKSRKIAYNLEMIYEAGIVDAVLSSFQNAHSITLFGSYRKGDDTEKSDIDIAVETISNDDAKQYTFGTLPVFGYRENVRINILHFNRNKININLFANLCNGIVLSGFLEAKP